MDFRKFIYLMLIFCLLLLACENQYSQYKIQDEPEFNDQYFQTSLKILEESIRKNPSNSEGYYRKALLFNKFKQDSMAIESLEKAIEIDQNNPEFYVLATQIYLDQEDKEKALSAAMNAEKAGLNNSWLYSNLANLSLEKGDSILAFEYIDKALNADPENPVNYFKKGNLYLSIRDTLRAEENYNQSLGLDSNNIELLTTFADIAIARRQFKQAKNLLNKRIQLGSPDQKYYLQSALLLFKTGDSYRARNAFRKLIDGEPDNFMAYNYISSIDFQNKQYDSALYYAEKTLALKNTSKEAILTIARIKDIKRHYYSAIMHYDKLIQLDTTFATAKKERAIIQKKINNLARSKEREFAPEIPTVQKRF